MYSNVTNLVIILTKSIPICVIVLFIAPYIVVCLIYFSGMLILIAKKTSKLKVNQ